MKKYIRAKLERRNSHRDKRAGVLRSDKYTRKQNEKMELKSLNYSNLMKASRVFTAGNYLTPPCIISCNKWQIKGVKCSMI